MRVICLPCEIQHREFDSKLILATRLAAFKGCSVLIGYDKYFSGILKTEKNICLLDKSMSTIMLKSRIKPCKDNGGIVFVHDEEGVNDLEETPAALDIRADSNSVAYIDKYLAWGQDDSDFFSRRKPGLSKKIVISGSHRYDLLNEFGKNLYAVDIDSIKNIFGDFILFNDNLAVDHFDKNYLPPTKLFSSSSRQESKATEEWSAICEEHRLRRDLVRDFILDLARKGVNIIVRPHPVYDSLYWHESFRLEPNIQTIYRGSVEPWIHASSAVVTTGCTTGLQALLADVPSYELPLPDLSRAFSSSVLPTFSLQDIISKKSNPRIDHLSTSNRVQSRWFHRGSSTEFMAEIINQAVTELPSKSSMDWLNYIPRMKPSAPKWRGLTTHNVLSRFHKIKSMLNHNDSLKCKKITTGLYIVYSS